MNDFYSVRLAPQFFSRRNHDKRLMRPTAILRFERKLGTVYGDSNIARSVRKCSFTAQTSSMMDSQCSIAYLRCARTTSMTRATNACVPAQRTGTSWVLRQQISRPGRDLEVYRRGKPASLWRRCETVAEITEVSHFCCWTETQADTVCPQGSGVRVRCIADRGDPWVPI